MEATLIMNELLSSVSLIASIIYFSVGFYVYGLNKKSELCRIFLFLNISMAIWSFGFSFAYIADTPIEYSFWNKLAAFGWCTFSSLILYLILVITENKFLKYWWVKFLVILPAPLFLFMVLFLFGPNIVTSPIIETLFYTGNFIYNFLYLFLSIFLLFIWGWKSNNLIQKKQSRLIVITSAIPFFLNLITESILPMFGISDIPAMGQIYSLIMLLGVYYAIAFYQFIAIPASQITSELFHGLSGLAFLVDVKGVIIKANKQSFSLLNYVEKEIINKPVDSIIYDNEIHEMIKNCESVQSRIEFQEIWIVTKTGEAIPFSVTITPMFNPKTHLFQGLLILGQDIRTTKILESEIIEHKLTYEKLRNSEELFRTIIEIIPFSIILTNRYNHKILYVNNKAAEFFNTDKCNIIGDDASNYYKNPNYRHQLIDDINHNRPIKEREIIFKRKDSSQITGLITMVPAIYLEQEVVLSCITDITEQRKLQREVAKSEKMLKELLHAIPDMVTVTDMNGNVTFANNSAVTVYGYDASKNFISENVLSLIAEEDLTRAKENMLNMFTNNPGPVEYKNVLKDGTKLDVEVNGMVICNDKNVPTEIIYVARNITERKQVEEKLKQNSIEIEKMNKELLEMNEILKNKSIRDSLTNLYNHQYINELLEAEILATSRVTGNLCVMMLDIDFFKRVNDTFGHQNGDKVLVVISELLLHNTRSHDLIGRYGGEEFIVVLPNIQLEEAYQIAENIRHNIQEYNFDLPDLKVTISVGLAQYESEDSKSFVNRADNLLYQAKRNGRNRIETIIN